MVSLEGLFQLLGSVGSLQRADASRPATPTCLLLAFLLLQGCGQGGQEVPGRVRFVRSMPMSDDRLPRRHVHGVMTVRILNAFELQHGRGRVSIALDLQDGSDGIISYRIAGTVSEVLGELAERGLHDVVARIDGCDWMLTRGDVSDTIDVLCDDRRLAVLKLGTGR